MSSRQDRIRMLAKRLSHDTRDEATESKRSDRTRRRHSVYIDAALMRQIDTTLKRVQHEIYPAEVTKSQFLEKLLERGLADLESITAALNLPQG